MPVQFIPSDTKIPFMKARHVAVIMSIVMSIASFWLVYDRGLNFGIDFEGGILVELHAEDDIDLTALRSGLGELGLGEVSIQTFGSPDDILIRFQRQEGEQEEQKTAVDHVVAKAGEIITSKITVRRVEYVGPKVSDELVTGGIIAVALAIGFSMLYLWWRFEWQFGVGAALSMVHDVALTMGLFAVTQLEFNLTIVAALLTIVGYSLNDTVVVFDRIRENLRKYRKMDLVELIDLSLNETLARTILTGISTFLVLFALLIFGGDVIRGLTAAMIWGLLIGVYSSVFVAAPVLPALKLRRETFDETAKTDTKP